jgi:plasmid maintenance system killer protein
MYIFINLFAQILMVKLKFKHESMELLYRDKDYQDRRLPNELRRAYIKKCFILETLENIQDLKNYRGLNFEHYKDHYSIRVNNQRRIEFDYDSYKNITIIEVLDITNHYKKNFNR